MNFVDALSVGKDGDQPVGFSDIELGASTTDTMADSVSIVTMERIESIFSRVHRGGARQAVVVDRILPIILNDFLPPRQVPPPSILALLILCLLYSSIVSDFIHSFCFHGEV